MVEESLCKEKLYDAGRLLWDVFLLLSNNLILIFNIIPAESAYL